MEILLQILDEIDDAASVLGHAAIALEAKLAGLAGWAAGGAFLAVLAGLMLGMAG